MIPPPPDAGPRPLRLPRLDLAAVDELRGAVAAARTRLADVRAARAAATAGLDGWVGGHRATRDAAAADLDDLAVLVDAGLRELVARLEAEVAWLDAERSRRRRAAAREGAAGTLPCLLTGGRRP